MRDTRSLSPHTGLTLKQQGGGGDGEGRGGGVSRAELLAACLQCFVLGAEMKLFAANRNDGRWGLASRQKAIVSTCRVA